MCFIAIKSVDFVYIAKNKSKQDKICNKSNGIKTAIIEIKKVFKDKK